MGLMGTLAIGARAQTPRLVNAANQSTLATVGGTLVVDGQFKRNFVDDPVACFEGQPRQLVGAIQVDNSRSESALKRGQLVVRGAQLLIQVEEQVCTVWEGAYDDVECVETADVMKEYDIPSCLSRQQDVFYSIPAPRGLDPSSSTHVYTMVNWLLGSRERTYPERHGDVESDYMASLTLEVSSAGRNAFDLSFRLSRGFSRIPERVAFEGRARIKGNALRQLDAGVASVAAGFPTQSSCALRKVDAQAAALKCDGFGEFKFPLSFLRGQFPRRLPRGMSFGESRTYDLVGPSGSLFSGTASLSQALASACRYGRPRVVGDQAALRSQLAQVSANPNREVGRYAEGAEETRRDVSIKYDPSLSLVTCEYQGRCLQTANRPPAYPGDDGLYCARRETGVLNRFQF